jgi:hypothetical protein
MLSQSGSYLLHEAAVMSGEKIYDESSEESLWEIATESVCSDVVGGEDGAEDVV